MNWIWSPLNIIPEGIFYRHFADTIQTHLWQNGKEGGGRKVEGVLGDE